MTQTTVQRPNTRPTSPSQRTAAPENTTRKGASRTTRPRLSVDQLAHEREILAVLVQAKEMPGPERAVRYAQREITRALESCPADETFLREWQLLARDLADALETEYPALSLEAATLAAELKAMVSMLARNPADRIAVRPASRRLLQTLAGLDERRPTLSRVRDLCGISATNLSNLLRPLVANGLVRSTLHPEDKRERLLELTAEGARLVDVGDCDAASAPYADRVTAVPPVSTEVYRQPKLVQLLETAE